MNDKAYSAFERDVPAHLREDAILAMAEATGEWGTPPNVTILNHDRIDAINCRAEGIIEIEGNEYTFQMEDGNWNGTVLLAWESDVPFERYQPTLWTLQPMQHVIHDAINAGRGPFLIFKWDAMIKRPEIARIPGCYAYDRRMQPGSKVEQYWKGEAAKFQLELVSEETAQETRKALMEAN